MSITLIALGVVLLIEAFIAWCLLDWRGRLRWHQRLIDQSRRTCYVCVTGASVLSFKSAYQFCPEHKAHWQLIHDLETQMFE